MNEQTAPGPNPGQTLPKPDRKQKLTPEQKSHIIALSREGMGNKEIADQLNIHQMKVNGIIVTARNFGHLPKTTAKHIQAAAAMAAPESLQPAAVPQTVPVQDFLPPAETPETEPMTSPAPQVPAQASVPSSHPAQPLSVLPGAVPEEFTGGRPILGGSGGFAGAPLPPIKWVVERIAPPDGVLGTHIGSFGIEELGQQYGAGSYRITKHDPSKVTATEFYPKVSLSYGPARSPNQSVAGARPADRPFFFGRGETRTGEEAAEERARMNIPIFRRPEVPAPYDWSRGGPSGGGVDKAIDTMGQMHEQSMKQLEEARKSSPDSFVTNFFKEQQETMNRRFEEERRRDEERRRLEEEKWDRRQQEDQVRHDRERLAEKERHEHELERIKAENEAKLRQTQAEMDARERREARDREDREKRETEQRKFLMDIEDRRLALIQQEAKNQQERLASELARQQEETRRLQERVATELAQTREATQKHIQDSEQSLQSTLDREREQLSEMHKLKEKSLDKQHELETKMLDIQRENAIQANGDHIFNTIQTGLKEFSKNLEKFFDLQKIKALTPEAQAGMVSQGKMDNLLGGGGNAPAQPGAPAATQTPATQEAASQTAASGGVGGNGHAPAAPAAQQNPQAVIEGQVQEAFRQPMFQALLEEWSLNIEADVDPSTFANVYLEMMRNQKNDDVRAACAVFAAFMRVRNWEKMYKVIKPHLSEEKRKIFELPRAALFYEAFRGMITAQVVDYWDQYSQEKIKQAGGNGQVAATKPGASPVPPAAPAAQAPVPSEPVPVPARIRPVVEQAAQPESPAEPQAPESPAETHEAPAADQPAAQAPADEGVPVPPRLRKLE